MSEKNKEKQAKVLQRIDDAINAIENKDFTMYFFVVDSKNVPNYSMEYIYQLAYSSKMKGYDVCMVYQLDNEYTEDELAEIKQKEEVVDEDRTFVGVGEWLGTEYMELRHMNIAKEEWKVSASDFLFIPEVFSSLMFQTYKYNVPCKRYVIMQNYDYMTENIPFGVQWANYGISDAIVSTDLQDRLLRESFPYVRTKVLNPYIPDYFRKPVKEPKLIVNIVAKNQDDVHRIMKPFYWKYPSFQFVSFRDLRGFPRRQFAELLQEGAITVWIDDKTPFGNSAVEAMRCGNIVIGKVPENIPEWMMEGDTLADNGIWFNNINDVHKIIAEVVASWLEDEIPEELVSSTEKTNALYSHAKYDENVGKLLDEIMDERKKELIAVKSVAKNNGKKDEE